MQVKRSLKLEAQRLLKVLTPERQKGKDLCALLGYSHTSQLRKVVRYIRSKQLAIVSSCCGKNETGYWIGDDGLEHYRQRALKELHRYNQQKRAILAKQMPQTRLPL